MKAGCEMRTIGVSLGIAGAVLWLALAGGGVALAAAAAPGSALNQLQATQATVTQMQQNPPAVPDDVPHAKDINEASRQFTAWQAEMFRQRDEIARKQAKMLHDRMKVPPPLPPSEPEPPMTRLDIPLPLWPANVNLSVSMGEPSVSFSVGAEAEALSCVGASYKVETAMWPARIAGPWRIRWRSRELRHGYRRSGGELPTPDVRVHRLAGRGGREEEGDGRGTLLRYIPGHHGIRVQ